MNYKLHTARLPLRSQIEEEVFDTKEELSGMMTDLLVLLSFDTDRVYLLATEELDKPIIITSNVEEIELAFSTNTTSREFHLHEYKSYEDAYKAALNMMEGHPLCYK